MGKSNTSYLVPGHDDNDVFFAAMDACMLYKMRHVQNDRTISVSGLSKEILAWRHAGVAITFDTRNVAKAFDTGMRFLYGETLSTADMGTLFWNVDADLKRVYPVVSLIRSYDGAYPVASEADALSRPFTGAALVVSALHLYEGVQRNQLFRTWHAHLRERVRPFIEYKTGKHTDGPNFF